MFASRFTAVWLAVTFGFKANRNRQLMILNIFLNYGFTRANDLTHLVLIKFIIKLRWSWGMWGMSVVFSRPVVIQLKPLTPSYTHYLPPVLLIAPSSLFFSLPLLITCCWFSKDTKTEKRTITDTEMSIIQTTVRCTLPRSAYFEVTTTNPWRRWGI